MRILCTGDLHVTDKKPRNRTDDYWSTVMNKFKQIMQIAEETNPMFVVFPGDIFETYKENHKVVQFMINTMRNSGQNFLVVAGNHDQQFHTQDLTGTAFETLDASRSFLNVAKYFVDEMENDKPLRIYGASWKDEIRVVDDSAFNILVIHKMIVDDKLWSQQEGHTYAKHLLQKHNYDLIISGDNHTRFIVKSGNKTLVNMGSMMRSTIAQVNHKPAVALYDTETREVTEIELKIEPVSHIMAVVKAEKEKDRNEKLMEFGEVLRKRMIENTQTNRLDFVSELDRFVNENFIDVEIKKIIDECLEDIK